MLDLLAGRYPSDEFAELRPRIVWERTTGALRAREGAQRIAIANAGTIPDRGLYGVFLVDGGGRVGELDEEMVHEAREGQVFLLGASAWRIEQIERDRVLVSPAPGQPAQVPFWKGEQAGRPVELGRAVGRLQRELAALDDESAMQRLTGLHACDERAARTLVEYLREQERATGVLPSDRTIVVERFRDEIGDWRLCILSPFGARVHAPWGLALRALLREQHGIETHALWSDDGIILHLPDADSLPPDELVAIDPDRIEDLVVGELGGSSLFGARFRESAARALLIPRRRPGPAHAALAAAAARAVAARGRRALRLVPDPARDLPRAARRPLRPRRPARAARRACATARASSSRSSRRRPRRSPRRSTSSTSRSTSTRTTRPPPSAASRRSRSTATCCASWPARTSCATCSTPTRSSRSSTSSAASAAAGADALHDLLRRVGDLAEAELPARLPGDAAEAAAELLGDRRALRVRIGGEDRLIAAEDIGRYRDALGAMPPGGIPAAFLEPVPDALRSLVRRFARWRGPFPAAALAERYDLEPAVAERELAALERAGRARARRPAARRQRPRVVRRRGAAPHPPRVGRAPAPRGRGGRAARAGALPPAWHGVGRKGRGGIDRLREVLFPLQRLPLAPEVWERQVLPLRMDYRPELLDQLCTSGEVVWLGADAGRVAISFREDAALLGPPGGQAPPPADPVVRGGARGARAARATSPSSCAETGLPEAEVDRGALAARGLGRGDERRLGAAAAHAPGRGSADARAARRHAPAHAPPPAAARRGARPLGADRAAAGGADRRGRPPPRARRAAARAPRRARARRDRRRGRARRARRACAARSASSRRSASRAAATSSTASAARSTRSRARSSACARCATPPPTPAPSRSPRAIPPTRTASPCAGRRSAAGRASRAAGALVVLRNGEPLAFVERGGAHAALAAAARARPTGPPSRERSPTASLEGRAGSLQLERIDGETATGDAGGDAFTAAGFVAGPKRLTLRARR